MYDWTSLTNQMGEEFDEPKDEVLKESLKILFANHDSEHPDAWIECGSEEGSLYTLSIGFSGNGIYTKYADADMEEELEIKNFSDLNEESSFALWKKLLDGNVSEI